MKNKSLRYLLAFTGLCVQGMEAFGQQSAPDAGVLLRESQKSQPLAPRIPAQPVDSVMPADDGPKVAVKAFEVTGSTRFSADEWSRVLEDLVGRELGFAGMQAAADRISLHYREAGLHALALLPEQDLGSGRVRILVVEGHLGGLRVATPADVGVPAGLVKDMLARGQRAGAIVDVNALERATLIANDIPGVKVSSVLSAGNQPGETDIEARIEPLGRLSGNVSVDNFDPQSTGQSKLVGVITINNGLGLGDQSQVTLQSSEGKQYLQYAYSQPLAANGLRGSFNISRLDYTLLGDFGKLGGTGNADTWGTNFSYPIVRSQLSNLNAQLSYSHSAQVSNARAGALSDKKSQSITLGLSGNAYGQSGEGVTIGSISLAKGDVDSADLSQGGAAPRTSEAFSKLQFSLSRLQRLSAQGAVWLSANGQLAFSNLDSGEEFSLGGPNGVRAYPALEAAGDQGAVMTAEYRHEFAPEWRGKAFVDWGTISVNRDNNIAVSSALNDYQLKGLGLGLDWSPSRFVTVRASVAWRLGENPVPKPNGSDSDGTKNIPQFWLQASIDL